MSDYRAQTQWENEQAEQIALEDTNEDRPEVSNAKPSGKRHRLWIVGGALSLFFILLWAGYYFGFSRTVEGLWIRQSDDSNMAGMTIEVHQEGDILQGKIVALPVGAPRFEIGQLKWEQLRRTGAGKYCFYDLICSDHDVGGETNREYHYNDTPSVMVISPGGTQLYIYNNMDPDQVLAESSSLHANINLGKTQVWIRQK